MATRTRTVLRVFQKQLTARGSAHKALLGSAHKAVSGPAHTAVTCPAHMCPIGPAHTGVLPVRTFASAWAQKKEKKEKKEEVGKEVKKEKKVIDDKDRHKPFGKTAWAPVDDVYVQRFYPRTIHGAMDAVRLLKRFQVLDFTASNQPVYVDLRLNMKLEKKKRIDPFVSTVRLPHSFKTKHNSVLVFTEDPDQVKLSQEHGALLAGGAELIQPILDDEISADFFVAVPEILPKLVPLKNKLRKKFPKSKRGSVGVNILKMLDLFQTGHEFQVEDDCYVRTQIATLDMDEHQIYENLKMILEDVCSHRPADKGAFIERSILASRTSEALWFRSEDVVPKPAEDKD